MPSLRTILALVTVTVATITGVPASAQVPAASAVTAGLSSAGDERAIVEEINAARRAHGLRPLAIAKGLRQAAAAHARSMARIGYFAHSSANGAAPARRIRNFYPGLTVGEALLWRSPNVEPSQVVAVWLASSSHRSILLSPLFREIGIGLVHASSAPGTYGGREVAIVVADFGTRSKS